MSTPTSSGAATGVATPTTTTTIAPKATSFFHKVVHSPMSLKDQYAGMHLATILLYSTAAISFIISYYLNRFIISVYAILGVALLYSAYFLPNWRGRQDTMADIKGSELEGKPIIGVIGEWVQPSETESFYGQLMEMRDAIAGVIRTETGALVTPAKAVAKEAVTAAPTDAASSKSE